MQIPGLRNSLFLVVLSVAWGWGTASGAPEPPGGASSNHTYEPPQKPVPFVPFGVLPKVGLDSQLGGLREPTIVVDPNRPQNLAYASLFELRVSTDQGETWMPPLTNVGTAAGLAINTDEDGDGLDGEDPIEAGVDNDGDGAIDEDPVNGVDDDGDTLIDEDPAVDFDNDGDGQINEDPCFQTLAGDPSLTFDSQGRLFWTSLASVDSRVDANGDGIVTGLFDRTLGGIGIDIVISQVSMTTGAIMAGYPINVTASPGVNLPGCQGNLHDKQWMAADYTNGPFSDRIYMVWSDLTVNPSRILTTFSTDQGQTWSAALQHSNIPAEGFGAEGFVWPSDMTVASNGDVYIAYHSQPTYLLGAPNGTSGQVFVRRSTDGGVSFPQKTVPYAAGQADMTFNVQVTGATIPQAQFWLQGSVQPRILADPDVPGRIYVIANDDPDNNNAAGDPADVFISISNDSGLNWSVPARVDKGPGTTFQVMPMAAIDYQTGCISVAYYDNRRGNTNAAGNFLLDVWMTTSTDGGLTFGNEVRISDVPFDPDPGSGCRFNCTPFTDNDGDGLVDEDPIDGINNDGDGLIDEDPPDIPTTRIGEYNGIAASEGNAYAVWCGNTFDLAGNPVGEQIIFDNSGNLIEIGELSSTFDPPDPWGKDGLLIETFTLNATVDLSDVRFFADALQCDEVPCEPGAVKKISGNLIEFVPEKISFLAAGESVVIEVKTTIPVGQPACTYEGQLHVVGEGEDLCGVGLSEDIDFTVTVLPSVDVDVDDNHGSVSDNVLHLRGSKGDLATGSFTVVNPNSEVKNVDLADGPGNIWIDDVDVSVTDLVKIGDPAVVIPTSAITAGSLNSLASGEAQDVSISVLIPDGVPVNAYYTGTATVTYQECNAGQIVSDEFSIQLEVLPTQGTLDIIETSVAGSFCPLDPWTMVGHVLLSFDVYANGDHRNIRVASGGLKHESMDKKLDEFNFFPEEIAFLAAGETRTIEVIVKIPIGQHSGTYMDYFRVVSENGGEDAVAASIEICPIYDLDIKDHYANLGDNIMEIQAIGRANQDGGEWKVRAFDIGLPNFVVNNHDEFDGPGNTPIDCIVCEFEEWSPLWHEDDHDHHFHNNFHFTGTGSVIGELCDWGSGEFRRMLVGLFVPPIQGTNNSPGTYKGRLDCWALDEGGEQVSHDFFDIEVQLARIVGPGRPGTEPADIEIGTFGGYSSEIGARLYWGDFSAFGLPGTVNLYRLDPTTGEYARINPSPLDQSSNYLDTEALRQVVYNYRIGITSQGTETFIGPIAVGGLPESFRLSQNAPNPFGDWTTIRYELPVDGPVSLEIFDSSGRLVRTLRDGPESAGYHAVTWDRKDRSGRTLSNGIYFYRLNAMGFKETKKMVLIRSGGVDSH